MLGLTGERQKLKTRVADYHGALIKTWAELVL